MRQAEFVSPGALRRHYSRIVEGYMTGLDKARANGEVGHDVDPEVAAWALMGIGEIVGMRWVLWGGRWDEGSEPPSYDTAAAEVPPHVFEQTMQFIERALAAPRPAGGPATTTDTEGDAQ